MHDEQTQWNKYCKQYECMIDAGLIRHKGHVVRFGGTPHQTATMVCLNVQKDNNNVRSGGAALQTERMEHTE
eukprot:7909785-Heterocapsa_arctica.AAC.1